MRILAVLTKGDTVAGTLDAAVMAAASVTCSSIEALNVMVDPMHLVSAPEEIDIQELREHDEGCGFYFPISIEAKLKTRHPV